ncbi:hypothetical protein MUG78_16735 [Gordonia alkaliphila]|uniref:hypothetical protein n=1 Tax=Gordonia alkaliphila TaxID=1053547 RepID=UPI001FF6B4FB|nr:hypothetical protein [Gordonia alkaliphila]MCK0441048.1 hypothetical protein [Gordonia alkaliphila]
MAESNEYTTEWFTGEEPLGEHFAAEATRASRWQRIPGGRALVVTVTRDSDSGWVFEASDYDTRKWPVNERFADAESALATFTAAARE